MPDRHVRKKIENGYQGTSREQSIHSRSHRSFLAHPEKTSVTIEPESRTLFFQLEDLSGKLLFPLPCVCMKSKILDISKFKFNHIYVH